MIELEKARAQLEEQKRFTVADLLQSRLVHFPYRKTLEEFDFPFQSNIDQKLIAELRTFNFINQAANLIFLGPPGVGNYRKNLVMERFSEAA